MKQGTVKWFNDPKGYGFITSEDQDFFVHFSSIIMSDPEDHKTLKMHDKVEFEAQLAEKGWQALNVKKVA